MVFPECVARVPVSLWGSGGWGCVRSTLRSRVATVRNRPQPFATVRAIPVWPCLWEVLQRWSFLEVSDVWLLRFAWQAWHFVTFRRVLERVESRFGKRNTFATFSEDVLQFSWQAQHFGRVHRHFSWQAQHFRRVVLRVFCQSHWQGCVKWRQGANSVAGVAFCDDVLKIDGSLARNIDFEVANFQVLRKTRRKTSILKLQSVKIGGSLARNARFGAPTCLVSRVWFSHGLAVSMGEAAKPVLLSCCQLWKLEEVSYEMLVFLHPRVLSRVAGFPVASPCLWGKLENLSFSNVSKQVVMSFCVAGVALCDIPTCLMMFTKMSKLEEVSYEMLVFLHPRVLSRVAGFPVASPCLWGKLENMSYSNVSKQVVMSFCVAGVALCDIPNLFDNVLKMSKLEEVSHEMLVFLASTCLVSSRWFSCGVALSMGEAPHSTLYTLHSTLHNLHFRLHTLHFTLHTLHFALYTPHSSPETLHSTLNTSVGSKPK